jgi:acyl-CoA synthetase (AMP-forming)/AMP-acid ligase II
MGPEEIEAVVRGHPAVREVCVVPEPDPLLGDAPAAVVELMEPHSRPHPPSADGEPNQHQPHQTQHPHPHQEQDQGGGEGGEVLLAEEIRLLVKTRLARYAYPRRVIFGSIPRNSADKMDRAATARLVALAREREEPRSRSHPP